MIRVGIAAILMMSLIACQEPQSIPTIESPVAVINLDSNQAENLLTMPLTCITVEYPNKLGQTLSSDNDLKSPSTLHPSFYGCFDWHSSVHGHWSMVYLLKIFPELKEYNRALELLNSHLTEENIAQEVAFLQEFNNRSFERTYGWAWLLKLAQELKSWNHPDATVMANNLQPLVEIIIQGYMNYLPKLNYPIRVGTHTNTAFGLTFAYDYAVAADHKELKELIEKRAKDYFLNDKGCPIGWEPSGQDFLSPCLEEVDIMRRILSKEAFRSWLTEFMPDLNRPDYHLTPGIVSDRNDGQLVHLDGVNFSRAWCLYGIATTLPEYAHLTPLAHEHIAYSIDEVVGDDYEGGHWLGTFAIYALQNQAQ